MEVIREAIVTIRGHSWKEAANRDLEEKKVMLGVKTIGKETRPEVSEVDPQKSQIRRDVRD